MRKRRARGKGWTSESGRRAAATRWAVPREETANDARRRALIDAKGLVVRELIVRDPVAGSEVTFTVRRSVAGRVDQLDLLVDGRVVMTAGWQRVLGRLVGAAVRATGEESTLAG